MQINSRSFVLRYRSLLPYALLALLLLVVAALAPWLVPQDPYAQNLAISLQPPSAAHWLGTDRYGRDLLSRVIAGAQTTLCASLALLLFTALVGSLVGVCCGYLGGRIDTRLMRLADLFLAFPEMVFAIAVAGVLGGGLLQAAAALALIGWPKYARLARGLVLTIRRAPYIEAARMAGCSTRQVLWQHILPNIAGPILVTAALNVGTIIMELAGLSFLGLGAMPPTAEWGAMMNNGRSMLQTAPWIMLGPGLAIFLSVAVFNLLGDKMRDVLDVRRA
jgi:peptide/nickel transport system permease protein